MTTQKLPRRSRKKAAEIDPTRIGQLLRLALSSDQPGEITAAVGALKRAMITSGIDLHQLAAATERGLRPAPAQEQQRPAWSGPPLPSPDDWVAMAWYCRFHHHRLRNDQNERVADYLLGQAFYDTDGRCMSWHLDELRAMVSSVRAAARSTEARR